MMNSEVCPHVRSIPFQIWFTHGQLEQRKIWPKAAKCQADSLSNRNHSVTIMKDSIAQPAGCFSLLIQTWRMLHAHTAAYHRQGNSRMERHTSLLCLCRILAYNKKSFLSSSAQLRWKYNFNNIKRKSLKRKTENIWLFLYFFCPLNDKWRMEYFFALNIF